MLKKIMVIAAVLLVSIGSMLVVTKSVHAETGYLYGKELLLGDGTNITKRSYLLTDGDTTTSETLAPASTVKGVQDVVLYNFPSAVNVEGFKLLATSENPNAKFQLTLNGARGVNLKTIDLNSSNMNNTIIPIGNVTDVMSVSLTMSDSNIQIYELDLFDDVPGNPLPFDIENLSINSEDVTASLSWDSIDHAEFSHYKVYQGSEVIQDNLTSPSLDLTGLEPETDYSFKVVAVNSTGVESLGKTVTTTTKATDKTPTAEVTDLTYTVDKNNVNFSYVLPNDTKFSHIEVYRDGQIIANDVVLNSFSDTGLEFDKTYQYIFKTVTDTGAKSEGKIISATIMPEGFDEAPAAPKNFKASELNGAISLSWDKSPEPYANGYYVYLNGVRVSDTPIKNNTYLVTGLDNGTSYSFSVSAVGTNGKESELSSVVTAEPDEQAMPVLKTDYSLKDVADGTANWFSSLWLIVAFAAAIPLSFYIGRQVKSLFLG